MLLAAVLSAWLQYVADGRPEVRVRASGACPTATVDGRPLALARRASPSGGFSDTVCAAPVAPDASSLAVDGRPLPAPARDPRTVVVFGDTGCRIAGRTMQACSDRVAWPFPSIAATIARLHPDLVVHVGDYYYRETPCTIPSCAGPSGDNSPAWDADWFGPAAPLFASAPLVLARGNHEDCARGGDGWFRYLDPRPALQCTAVTAPWSMTAGSLRLVVFDSASADDLRLDPALDVAYRTQFSAARALAGSAGGTTWFVTHRPVYTNANERVTMGDALAPFDAILAGHIHTFAAIDLSALPPLIVNGEGGDLLDSDADSGAILSVAVSDLRPTAPPLVRSAFGFAVYTRTAAGWDVSLRAVDGSERLRCALAKRHVRCSDVPHPAST